jgi:heme A synthase
MPRSFARYAASVLAYNVAVVLWGAYVRATGSGAGCGNHWPLCNGVVVPEAPALTTIIEFTHRASSGIDVVLVGILLVWAWRAFPPQHLVRLGALLSAVFLTTEALIGAALVKLEHVAHNASAGRGYSLSGHLINTLTLLACLTLTVWWASGGTRLRFRQRASWLAAPGIVLAVLVGISGAIAALGDTLFPASSLAAGFRQDFDPASSIFLRLRLLHPLLALITGAWLIFYAEATAFRLPAAKRFARLLEALVGVQIAAGATNLLLLAPVGMQMMHLLLADLVWISLVLLVAFALQDFSLSADMRIDEMVPGVGGLERAGAKQP